MLSRIFNRFYALKAPKKIVEPKAVYRLYPSVFRGFAARTDFWHDSKVEVINKLNTLVISNGESLKSKGVLRDVEVKEGGEVIVLLELTQDYRKTKALIENKLKEIPWIKSTQVKMAPQEKKAEKKKINSLKDIKNILAVSSCKGGVGKSTVATNIAFSIHKLGKRVGIFDADVYGPSLPTLVNTTDYGLRADISEPNKITPHDYDGVKAMSYGFVAKGQRAVMRGPMVSSLITQLITNTNWGELDYLVLDLPPGTGDIPITLCQEISITAALIVTTPQKLSYVDVIKGIEMFDSLKVPTVGILENMSYFMCDKWEKKHRIFGLGYTDQIKHQFGIKNSFEIPLIPKISELSDEGAPLVLALPEEVEIVQRYLHIAKKIMKEWESLEDIKNNTPEVFYSPKEGVIRIDHPDASKSRKIYPRELRLKCKWAAWVDELTGNKTIIEDKIPQDVYPTNMIMKGNYAVAVVWSDGHNSSIYPYDRLLSKEIKGVDE